MLAAQQIIGRPARDAAQPLPLGLLCSAKPCGWRPWRRQFRRLDEVLGNSTRSTCMAVRTRPAGSLRGCCKVPWRGRAHRPNAFDPGDGLQGTSPRR
ncbi:hypothetical protein LV779_35210 [Streptomyces thinghirensis]|nr:hypothetical protein [Streptomyces thinghirensis]